MPAEEQEGRNWIIKLLILGDIAVGKTSLINQYIHKKFKEDYHPTLGVNMVTKEVIVEDIRARLILWDIAGQSKYDLSRTMYFQGASGALFVYDITRYSTFKSVKEKWLDDFNKYGKTKGIHILIGNKSDLKDSRLISEDDGKELAEDIGASEFIETSAKAGENVEKAFETLVRNILTKMGAFN